MLAKIWPSGQVNGSSGDCFHLLTLGVGSLQCLAAAHGWKQKDSSQCSVALVDDLVTYAKFVKMLQASENDGVEMRRR